KKYSDHDPITIDGLKIVFESSWVQLRKSNTEPIVRVYAEGKTAAIAEELSERFITEINQLT
ncbi:MAG: phosphoglucosamine mutase, partial [Flavobacteriaceae bacterium]